VVRAAPPGFQNRQLFDGGEVVLFATLFAVVFSSRFKKLKAAIGGKSAGRDLWWPAWLQRLTV